MYRHQEYCPLPMLPQSLTLKVGRTRSCGLMQAGDVGGVVTLVYVNTVRILLHMSKGWLQY